MNKYSIVALIIAACIYMWGIYQKSSSCEKTINELDATYQERIAMLHDSLQLKSDSIRVLKSQKGNAIIERLRHEVAEKEDIIQWQIGEITRLVMANDQINSIKQRLKTN